MQNVSSSVILIFDFGCSYLYQVVDDEALIRTHHDCPECSGMEPLVMDLVIGWLLSYILSFPMIQR